MPALNTTTPPPVTVPSRRPSRLNRVLRVLEPLSVATLLVYLLNATWLRWADPLIDFPKDLYLSWRVSEGDMLYQKITNWYGPLSHLTEAVGFRIFGVGMDTVVWMNIVLLVVALLLLRAIFGALGNPLSVWLGSIIFLIVFAFGHLTETANYNFIAPYASQATYCFLGLLFVLWGLLRHLQSGRLLWLGVAGFGFAVAYLDKPEGVLAAAGALGLYFIAQAIYRSRVGDRRWWFKALAWLAGGFFSLVLPVFAYFWWRGGVAYAFTAVNYTITAVFNSGILGQVTSNRLQQSIMGFDHTRENFLNQTGAGLQLVYICGAMIILARMWRSSRPFSPKWWMLLLGVVTVVGEGILVGWQNDSWLKIGPAFAFPVIIAAAIATGWSLWLAWQGGKNFPRTLGVAVVGVAASLMLARMILNVRLSQYGFFMMPLAVWFWIHLMTVEAGRCGKNAGGSQRGWLLPAAFAAVVLVAAIMVMNFEIFFYSKKTFAYGSGRDRAYTFPPSIKSNGTKFAYGFILNTMIAVYRKVPSPGHSLVAFPEGIAVNYHLRIPSPLAEAEFHPLALGYVGPEHVLAELQANPPEAILLFDRNMEEFGTRYFGDKTASGRDIMLWILANYRQAAHSEESTHTMTAHLVDLYLPTPLGPGPFPDFGPY